MYKLLISILLCLPCLGFAQTSEELRSDSDTYLSAVDLKTTTIIVPDFTSAVVVADSPVFQYISSLNQADAAAFTVSRSGASVIIEKSGVFNKDAYSDAYKYGDVVFLICDLDDKWTYSEWTRYYTVAKWLATKGFRVIINPVAQTGDIRAAVQDDRTKVIVWSSHGSQDGGIYDTGKTLVPTDAFFTDAGRNFKQIIVSSCYGDVMVERYAFPAGLERTHWEGTTSSDDLFNYLNGDKWDPRTLGEN